MKIKIPYRYTETEIPPRCRKPRRVDHAATIALTFHEITADEAPIAIVESGGFPRLGDRTVEYRWWRDRLWTSYYRSEYSRAPRRTMTAARFAAHPYPHWSHRYQTQQQCRADFRRWASSIVFIDGMRWDATDEPRYVVMTFGLGGNHGGGWGTSLSNDNGYNSNIGRERYFRCDEYGKAVAAATRIARARGDTKALPIESQRPRRFEILIPEAVKLRPAKEHGAGDPFINSIERMIEAVHDPMIAGFGLLALTANEVKKGPRP